MNNTMVRERRGTKINPKSSFKNQGAQNTRDGNYASKYGIPCSIVTLQTLIFLYLLKQASAFYEIECFRIAFKGPQNWGCKDYFAFSFVWVLKFG